MSVEDAERYRQALHGVQSAILFEQSGRVPPYHALASINKDARMASTRHT